MSEPKTIVYVFCFDNNDYFQYQKQNPQHECIMLVDGTVLRGRSKAPIVKIGRYDERWNAQDIMESINRAIYIWDGDQGEIEQNEQDIEYGV